MSGTPPVISIVTPCLNRAGSIADAIENVLAQNYSAFEHIVIDGGSTDGTLEVLARYPHLRIVSEPDRNLYDAMNKGLRLVRGDVVGFLNSDDLYGTHAFNEAAQALANPDIEMVIGAAEIFTHRDGREIVLRRYEGSRAIGLLEANAIGNITLINSCFYRRSLITRTGLFDDRFPLAADKDFWMRLVLDSPSHRFLSCVFYRYQSHGGSLTFSGNDMRDTLSSHFLTLARTRVVECSPGTREHAAYRRWHAWAVGYRAIRHAAMGRVWAMLRTLRDGCDIDAAWPLRFVARLPGHWRDRGTRPGLRAQDLRG